MSTGLAQELEFMLTPISAFIPCQNNSVVLCNFGTFSSKNLSADLQYFLLFFFLGPLFSMIFFSLRAFLNT